MELWDDAMAQAAAVRNGEVSPGELVDAAISRIEELNPALNAVIHRRFEAARRQAAGPLPDGPFRGVPILLKDLHNAEEGQPHHCGMAALKEAGWRADHDNAVVRRIRQAGFVIVGRTNVPELGTTITTEPVAYGPTRNPWNVGHSAGGSSGGSAAAVAAGMVAVAHGSDGGGSIRIPASECGLVGLKPARARVSKAPDAGEGWMGASTDGALTRTVRDAAALLDVLSGAEPGDPYHAFPLDGPLAVAARAADVAGPSLRIGLMGRPAQPGVPADPEAEATVAAAGRLLESLGHHVEQSQPAALAEAEFADHFLRVVAVHTAAEVDDWSARLGRPLEGEVEPRNALFCELGRASSGPQYVQTVNWLHGWSRRVAGWWEEGWDVLVSPVLNGPPPPIGWLDDPDRGGERVAAMLQYTAQWNVTGQPAVSLPLGRSDAGLPMGVQLVAAAGREDVLVRLAAQVEGAAAWSDRHPPL
ncbi:MAG TPA: amidase [Acidimicrobiales bacterium]|nr:amidase [Acidimicrobiales bacterium]